MPLLPTSMHFVEAVVVSALLLPASTHFVEAVAESAVVPNAIDAVAAVVFGAVDSLHQQRAFLVSVAQVCHRAFEL